MDTSHQFDLQFQRFKQELDKNTHELEARSQESRKYADEIVMWEKNIQENKRKIEHLRPELRRLEQEKIRRHGELQRLEEQNRARVNEHLTDQGKKIKPSTF